MLRLLVLLSCGTRTVIDAVFSPVSKGETTCAPGLLGSLHAGMILLADRNFGAGFLAAQIAGTKADFLIRVRAGYGAPGLPVLSRLSDGSWLSRFGGIPVRVIDAQITFTTSAGCSAAGCRLVTTLLDRLRVPQGDRVPAPEPGERPAAAGLNRPARAWRRYRARSPAVKLVWDEAAWDDYIWWQQQDRKILKRINTLIAGIQRNGNEGIGKPEPLKHGFQGYWSRRITDEHRLVYKIIDEQVRIAACRHRYEH